MFKYVVFKIRYFFKVVCNTHVKAEGFVYISSKVKILIEENATLFLGKNVVIKEGTIIYVKKGAFLTIGNDSSTGHHTEISVNESVRIGRDVLMGAYTYITDSNHSYKNRNIPIRKQTMQVEETVVGDNVWLGRGVMLLKGAKVDSNSVVAAGSIVTKKFGRDLIIGGVPAKVIKGTYE